MTTILCLGLMQQRDEVDRAGTALAATFANAGMHTLLIHFGPSPGPGIHTQSPVPFAKAMMDRFSDLEGMIVPTHIPNLDYAELGYDPAMLERRLPEDGETYLAGHLLALSYDFVVMLGQWNPECRLLKAQLVCSDFIVPVFSSRGTPLPFNVADLPLDRIHVAIALGDETCRKVIPRGIRLICAKSFTDRVATRVVSTLLSKAKENSYMPNKLMDPRTPT